MKASAMIAALQDIINAHGDLDCSWQSNPSLPAGQIVGDTNVFLAVEEYREEDGGVQVNIRNWPH